MNSISTTHISEVVTILSGLVSIIAILNFPSLKKRIKSMEHKKYLFYSILYSIICLYFAYITPYLLQKFGITIEPLPLSMSDLSFLVKETHSILDIIDSGSWKSFYYFFIVYVLFLISPIFYLEGDYSLKYIALSFLIALIGGFILVIGLVFFMFIIQIILLIFANLAGFLLSPVLGSGDSNPLYFSSVTSKGYVTFLVAWGITYIILFLALFLSSSTALVPETKGKEV